MNYPDLYVSSLMPKARKDEPQKSQLVAKHKDKKVEDGKSSSSERVKE